MILFNNDLVKPEVQHSPWLSRDGRPYSERASRSLSLRQTLPALTGPWTERASVTNHEEVDVETSAMEHDTVEWQFEDSEADVQSPRGTVASLPRRTHGTLPEAIKAEGEMLLKENYPHELVSDGAIQSYEAAPTNKPTWSHRPRPQNVVKRPPWDSSKEVMWTFDMSMPSTAPTLARNGLFSRQISQGSEFGGSRGQTALLPIFGGGGMPALDPRGIEERYSGHVAVTESTSLPRIYSAMLKDDVQHASARLEQSKWITAERRRHCDFEMRKQDRARAANWRRAEQMRRKRNEKLVKEAENFMQEQKARASQLDDSPRNSRWQRALERIKKRDTGVNEDDSMSIQQFMESETIVEEAGVRVSLEAAKPPSSEGRRPSTGKSGGSGGRPASSGRPISSGQASSSGRPMSSGKAVLEGSKLELAGTAQSVGGSRRGTVKSGRALALNTHLELLRKVRKLKVRAQRATQSFEARKERYDKLSQEQKDMCETAFLTVGPNPQQRTLGIAALRTVLYEVGLRGNTMEEENALLNCCSEAVAIARRQQQMASEAADGGMSDASKFGVDLYHFATQVVAKAEKQLSHLRQEQLETLFWEKDEVGDGYIRVNHAIELARTILGPEVSGEDLPHCLALAIQETSTQEEDHTEAIEEDINKGTIVDLTLFQAERMLSHLSASVQRKKCIRERQIQEANQIDRENFQKYRPDILLLHQLYRRHAGDGRANGLLQEDACAKLFREFGVSSSGRRRVGRHGIDFADLLELVEQMRTEAQSWSYNDLRTIFAERFQGKGRAHVTEVVKFINEHMSDIASAEAVNMAVRDVLLSSGSEDGFLSFAEVKRCMQRAREHAARMKRQLEVRTAIENGFKESELDELHAAFDHLDQDESGALDMDEAWEACCMLNLEMSKPAFQAGYNRVDEDGSGALDFQEFLFLLRQIRDREGVFADNRKIMTLSELTKPECIHLLSYFHNDGQVEHLSESVLLRKVCECFDLFPECPLPTRLNIATFQELCVYASTEAEKNKRRRLSNSCNSDAASAARTHAGELAMGHMSNI
mmetsp:Transcript_3491/g.5653  ORF Transcript_3491/g.5653 Transcript_3491/m.5653 type:complete len:1048 (-) Transcript_3491:33-3176(-)